MPFIVPGRAGSLMMHKKFHSFGMCIVIKSLYVEIRIWGYEVKDIVLIAVCPIFPTFIPSFYKHLVKTMLSCKINVASYICIVC